MIFPDSFERKIGFDFVRRTVLELCSQEVSRAMAREMTFSADAGTVRFQLECVCEMFGLNSAGNPVPLGGIRDVGREVSSLRVPGSFLTSNELFSLGKTLNGFVEVKRFFASMRSDDGEGVSPVPRLDSIVKPLGDFPECASIIDRVVDRFGNVRDNASPELAEIRRDIAGATESVNAAMRRVVSRAVQEGLIDSDTAPTMRDGRLVIPVAPMNKRKISGIVHDESASGKTVFIEPAEVVSANNRIRELQLQERREIARILLNVADSLRVYVPELLDGLNITGHLDFINAKALFAADYGGTMPHLHNGPELEWYHACHPGLLSSLRKHDKEIVPLNIMLNSEKRILVISGPNAGGKSVCLKTVGMVQYMAQCGLLPPVYENSHVGIFDNLFIDIGDDQSLEDDLSTYSSHLRNMRYMLRVGNDRTLLLIDEFGGGTEPQIGGALAQAILKRFNEMKMWGVVTTHYQNLKLFAEHTEGLVNGSMLYDRQQMRPLFTLSIGNAGSSFALEIARKTGLPHDIIAEAEEIVGSEYVNADRYLLDIARDKRYWENKRQQIRVKEKKIEDVLQRYETEAETLREKRRDILAEAKAEAKKILEGSNAAVERAILEIRESQADKERTLSARNRLKSERDKILDSSADERMAPKILRKAPKGKKKPLREPEPANMPLAEGDMVRLDGDGTPGQVLRIDGNKALVAFGMLKTAVEVSRLRKVQGKAAEAKKQSVSVLSSDSSRSRRLNFSREIDVRGMRVDEAVQAVTYFIDDAIQFAADRVRILHGTGTGALRQYIRNYLATVPGVKKFHDEHVQFGGAGITVVELSE